MPVSPSRSDTRQHSRAVATAGKVLGLAGIMLVAVLAALLVWLSRESTLHAAADALVRRSDGQLTLDGVSGTLLRPIHIEHAVLRNGRYEFTLDEATLRWSPFWLLTGVVAFDPVNVNRVRIIGGTASDEPARPPQSLALPVKLRLERVAIGKLVLAQSDTEREIGPLTMDIHAGAKSLTVAVEPAQTPWGSVALHADIANEAPFVLHGNVDWKREGDRPITGRLEASGELARIDLRSSIRAQSSAIEANAIVQPFAHPVIERAQAQLHAVDLRHFTEGTLAAVWDGTLDVAADGPIVHGKMAVTNNMPGAVDEGRVPLGTVAAAVHYADGGWDLTDVRVGLGPAGELSGGGTLKPHEVAVTLRGDAV